MEVTVTRTGGLAGVNERLGPVNTRSMDAEVGRLIEAKVEEIGFFDLPAELPERVIYDAFHYCTTVVGERTHSVRYGDGSDGHQGLGELTELLLRTDARFENVSFALSEDSAGESFQWEAWYNRMPGTEDENLYVAGKCGLPSSKADATLVPYADGGGQGIFVLELKIEVPDWGDTRYWEKEVDWHGEVGSEFMTVRVRGDVDLEIPVGERV